MRPQNITVLDPKVKAWSSISISSQLAVKMRTCLPHLLWHQRVETKASCGQIFISIPGLPTGITHIGKNSRCLLLINTLINECLFPSMKQCCLLGIQFWWSGMNHIPRGLLMITAAMPVQPFANVRVSRLPNPWQERSSKA